jgi:hypothetical protein
MVGQGFDGTKEITEKFYIWGNTGYTSVGGTDYPDQCGRGLTVAQFVQQGRDYELGPKPGWARYTYPHPLRADQGGTGGSDGGTGDAGTPHSVSLSWNASTTAGVVYNVYRGSTSGGPYSVVASGVTSTSFVDHAVNGGATYYYMTTAVSSNGLESVHSNEVSAVVP